MADWGQVHDRGGPVARGATAGQDASGLAQPFQCGLRYGCLLAAAQLCLLPILAPAQTVENQASPSELKRLSLEELADIEVTSVSRRPEKLSGTASAIQVITADEIRRSGATSIPEALRLADNLDVAQVNAHDWAITARGFNTSLANKLLVLIDGRTVYTPLFSGVFWERQDYLLADIDRIEVISGPGGTLWGANAVNGVINIITKSARDTQGTYLETGGGTQLKDFAGVRYGGAIAPGVAFRVYGEYFNRSDETRADGASNNDAWHKGQGGFRVDAGLSQQDALTLQGDFYRGDEGIATGGVAGISGGNLLGRWSHTLSPDADWTLQVYYDRTRLSDPIPALVVNSFALAAAGILTDDLDTYDIDFQNHLRIGGRNHLVWGLGFRHTHDVVGNAPGLAFLPPVLNQNLYSAFVQDEVMLRENLFFTLGTKLEHNDYTGFEVEPSARLQWNFAGNQMLWAAVSRAVRTPSRIDRDLSEPAPPAPIILLEGSPDFTSEAVIAHELGYRAELGPRATASVSTFFNDYQNVRSTSLTPATLLPLVFRNNLEGNTRGIELSTTVQLADAWRVRGGYDILKEDIRAKPGQSDFNDARNETADPEQWLSLRSTLDLPHATEFDTTLRWVDTRTLNNGPTIGSVPSYWELDMRFGWHPTDTTEVSIVGQNLLHDHHPEYGFPSPTRPEIGRSLYGKIVWRF